MRFVSWQTFFRSLSLTTVLFCASSLLFSLVEARCYGWFGTERMDNAAIFWDVASTILIVSVMLGFRWSRGKAVIEKKPIVVWLLAVPVAFLFATILAMLHSICYLTANTAVVYGLAETAKVPQMVADIYWKSGNPLYEPLISFEGHPILTIALFMTVLFGCYGPLRGPIIVTPASTKTDGDNWPPPPKRAI